jgi:catechol 2,3-dioxygenase-like lactoylglutathione lyase family enzyme
MAQFSGLRHLALKVRDVERAACFYEKAFGMRRFSAKGGGQVIPLVSPGVRDQITVFSGNGPGEAGDAGGKAGEHGGIDHFGFFVKPGARMDRVASRIVAAGAEKLHDFEIAPGVPSMFFRDPDGYVFQVIRFPRLTGLYVWLMPLLDRFGLRKT